MLKKLFSTSILLVLALLFLTACGDSNNGTNVEKKENNNDNSEQASNNQTSEEENNNDGSKLTEPVFINLLGSATPDPAPIDSSNFEVIDFSSKPDPKNYLDPIGSHGMLLFEDNNYSYLIDYLSGKGLDLQAPSGLEDQLIYGSRVSSDEGSSWLEGKLYVSTRSIEDTLFEVNPNDGTITRVLEAPSITMLAKKDGIFYIIENDNLLYAIDENTEERLWETEVDLDYSDLYVTENAVVQTSMYGLHAYSKENGELLYKENDYVYDLLVDGDTFYALNKSMETNDAILQVVEYDDQDGKKSTLIETPKIEYPHENYLLELKLIDNIYYIYFESGIFAYDAETYDLLWTFSVGENIEKRSDTGDDFKYDYYAAFGEEHIYVTTYKFNVARDRSSYISVVNAKTGEVLEHYLVGDGNVTKPIVDETTSKVVIYYYDYNDDDPFAKAYIADYK